MQISKYKSPKLQIVGQNLLDPWDWSEQANMPRLGQLVIIWLGGRRHSLNKYAGGDDEFRMGTDTFTPSASNPARLQCFIAMHDALIEYKRCHSILVIAVAMMNPEC